MLAVTLLRDCLCSLLEGTLGGPVCRCAVYPSVIHTADVCEKTAQGHGEAKISITNIYDSQNFPFPLEFGNCNTAYTVIEVTQTVWRCAPAIENDGELPSVEDEELTSAILLDDARAMRCAINCCLGIKLISVGQWQLLPANGGCAGGRLVSTIGLDPEACFDLGSL